MMMRRLLLCLAALLVMARAGLALDAKSIDAVKGAQSWFVEDHSVPVVAMVAALPAGSAYDPPGQAGMAALAAAMLEEGSHDAEGLSFQTQLSAHAIRLTVTPRRDYLEIAVFALHEDAPEAFRLLGEALARPQFSPDVLQRVRDRLLQAIAMNKGDPAITAWNGMHSLFFGAHSYGHPIEGDAHGLNAIKASDVQRFSAGHWVRGGMKIALAGDVDAEEAKALLGSAFDALPQKAPAPPSPPLYTGAPGLHVLPIEAAQPAAVFVLPGIKRNDPDYLAAVIANLILGGGVHARLGRELRVQRGLTYDVSTELVSYREAGVMVGAIETKPSDMRKALALVRGVMRRFAFQGPQPQEFADAKLYLRGMFPLSFTSNFDIAVQLADLMEAGLPIDYLQKRGRMIDNIGIDDVRRAARRLYGSDRITMVVAGPLPEDKKSTNPYRN